VLSEAWLWPVVFAVRRSVLLPFFALVGLALGCSAPRDSARYGWLNKHGEVQATGSVNESAKMARSARKANSPKPFAFAVDSIVSDLVADVAEASTATVAFAFLSGPAASQTARGSNALSSEILTNRVVQLAGPDTAYYTEQDHRWNAKAIASLPLAIATVVIGVASQSIYLLLIGGAISFALGMIGSRQCRDREHRGKGFAIAGMALGAAALFFSLMVLIWAA
jgi:hypothetical protein